MRNVIVANFPKNGKRTEELIKLVRAQIHNAQIFGWRAADFIIVTNISYLNDLWGTWFVVNLNDHAYTASKLFAAQYLYKNKILDEPIWLHDLDAWQNAPFVEPQFADAGFCHYSRPTINGGSQFWRPSGIDIIDTLVSSMHRFIKEEPCLNEKLPPFGNRITVLNSTYNIGCSGFLERYAAADKPIKICHLHPTNRIAWQTHALNRNGLGVISVSDQLRATIKKFFKVQDKLDEEGLLAQANKIKKYGTKFKRILSQALV